MSRPDVAPGVPAGLREGPGLVESALRAWWVLLLAGALAGIAGYALSNLQPVRYHAQARILLSDPREAGVFREFSREHGGSERHVRKQAELVQTAVVLERALAALEDERTVEELREDFEVVPAPDVDLLVLNARDATPQRAADVANAIGQAYEEVVSERLRETAASFVQELERTAGELRRRIAAAESRLEVAGQDPAATAERDAAATQLAAIEVRIEQIAVDAALYGSGVQLFDGARPPDAPVQPRPRRDAAGLALLGAGIAGVVSWYRAGTRQVLRSPEQATVPLDAPLVGTVAERRGGMPLPGEDRVADREGYSFALASTQALLSAVPGGRIVLVTSASPGDGKTTTSLHLAAAAVRTGQRVLVVDADGRERGLSEALGLPRGGPGRWQQNRKALSDGTMLDVLTLGGGEDPAALLRDFGLRRAIEVHDGHDLVLVDSPALLGVAESTVLASQVDGIVVVVNRGSSMRQAEAVRNRLDLLSTPLLGYVFNRAAQSQRGPAGRGRVEASPQWSRRLARR
jgi:Mrp family chromosome partitioning ATPase/capsular polysaccharide biosynthesis protein